MGARLSDYARAVYKSGRGFQNFYGLVKLDIDRIRELTQHQVCAGGLTKLLKIISYYQKLN